MSFERYIEFLQQIITMTDPDDPEEMLAAENVLKNLLDLARRSHKADPLTLRAMRAGCGAFQYLMRNRDNFAGKPGDVSGNRAKRQRLAQAVRPNC